MRKIIRRIVGYTNLVFAILLVLSALSPNISPARMWGPSFMGLAFPYILLINAVFLIFLITRKKREFIISLLAILLSWNTLSDYVSMHPGALFRKGHYERLEPAERSSLGQLKIMSFNVRTFDRYRWTQNPSASQDIFDMFRQDDPDILCLQEFYTSGRGSLSQESVAGELDRTPYKHLEYALNRRNNKYGLGIFSRYPIVNGGRVILDKSMSICSFADINFFGDTLRVYNMHLQSIRLSGQQYKVIDSLRFRYDNQQMDEIRDISDRLRDAFVKRASQAELIRNHIETCPFPVIVCGDFNDTPVSYSYRHIRSAMLDAFSESGWGIGRTYDGKFPSFRIDYILCDPFFEVLHFARKKVRLSDHFPVTAYLGIRKQNDLGEQIRGWVISE